jgi:TonB family protein
MKILSKFVAVFCLSLLVLAMVSVASAGDDRKVKNQVSPVYPELAKSMHINGTVKVEVTIGPNGNVTNAKVVGGHPVLADAALKAVEKWRFDAGPAETRVISFDFKGN